MSRSRCLFARWPRIIGLPTVLVALSLLQACSAIKLGYNNAPDLAYWWIDGYADLSGAQSLKVKEDLARLQQWHRGNELPKVADLLQKAAQLAPANTTGDQVCALITDVRARLDAVSAQAEPAMVSLATSLSPAQISHIEAKYEKSNADWRDDWMSPSLPKRQAKRLKTAVERSEQFYGSLDERQVAILRDFIAQSDFDPQFSYTERLRRQQDMLQTLKQINGAPADATAMTATQATSAVHAYLERSVNSPNPAYRAYLDKEIAGNCRAFALLHNNTSTQQRERAVRRLAAYERDARELAAQR